MGSTAGLTGKSRSGRKLIAVVYADMVGYSRLIELDDTATLERLRTLRSHLIDPSIEENGGTLVQTGGDSLLIVFDSIDGAIRCAVHVQQQVPQYDGAHPPDRVIRFRIGINIGDAIADGSDLHGDAVNIAARLQTECPAGGICVSRAVRDHVRDRLDVEFESLGALTLKNIARPIVAFALRIDATVTSPSAPGAAREYGVLKLPDKPSVAVLAFRNTGGDPDQEYFSDGIAEDIITHLSRSRALFVIARNSTFTYKARVVDVRQIGRELGVRYVLEGSVRRAGVRVRVTAQLIDAASANHIWAEQYDRDLADIFAVQDEITSAVALAVEPAISDAEQQRVVRRPPDSLGAWEAYQRGMWHHASGSVAENCAARAFFQRAVEIDPNFSPGFQGLVHTYIDDATLYLARSPAEAAAVADPFARKAVMLDKTDAGAWIALNYVAFARGDLNASLALAEQALKLDPNSATANWARSGSLTYLGRFEEGAVASQTFLRLSPRDPRAFRVLNHLAIGRYLVGDYSASIEAARQALWANPDQPLSYQWLVASLGQLGKLEEARAAIEEAAPRVAPVPFEVYAAKRGPWLREGDHVWLLEGLRKSGMG